MHAMARHGIDDDIPVIEQWLNDKTVIMEYQRIAPPEIGGQRLILFQVKARDLALAATIVRHRENPFDILPLFRSHPLRGFISEHWVFPKRIPIQNGYCGSKGGKNTKSVEKWLQKLFPAI